MDQQWTTIIQNLHISAANSKAMLCNRRSIESEMVTGRCFRVVSDQFQTFMWVLEYQKAFGVGGGLWYSWRTSFWQSPSYLSFMATSAGRETSHAQCKAECARTFGTTRPAAQKWPAKQFCCLKPFHKRDTKTHLITTCVVESVRKTRTERIIARPAAIWNRLGTKT